MSEINEDLRKWLKQKWVRFDTKGNIKGDCAREPGEGKPKCLPQAKAHALGKKKRASAARRKRREDPHAGREGKAKFVKTHNEETIHEIRDVVKAVIIHSRQLKRNAKTLAKNPNLTTAQKIRYAVTHGGMKGQEAAEKIWDYPYNVTTPTSGALYTAAGVLGSPALNIAKITARLKKRRKKMNEETLLEKNVPTNPKLWAQAKAQAKKKFKIYPSAYANLWASKWYKSKGGGWKSLNEDYEYEMARNELRTAMRGIERLMKHLDGEGDLEAWVQSKLTKASDYIDTLADYMDSRDKTVKEAYELISEAKKKMDKRTIPQTVQMQTPGSNPYADDSTCPSYVSTPGQPITEARSLKGEYKRLAGKKGPKAAEQRELLKALARGRHKKAEEKKAKAEQAAKTPLYTGPKKGSAPTKPKTPAVNLSPKMGPRTAPPTSSYDADMEAIKRNNQSAENFKAKMASMKSKEEPSRAPVAPHSPPKIRGANPEVTDFGGVGAFEKYVKETPAHKFDEKFARKIIAHEYNQTLIHPIWGDEAEKNLRRNKRLLKQIGRVSKGKNPLTWGQRAKRMIGLGEEHGAGDVGTTELVQNYIAATPGQILDPAEHKKPKITDTIKKVVKEEILNEYTRLATSAGHRTGVTVTKPRSGSAAGRVRRTGKKHRFTTTRGRQSSRPAKPKPLRPRENPISARRAATSSLRKAQFGARTRERNLRASERIADQQRRARLR